MTGSEFIANSKNLTGDDDMPKKVSVVGMKTIGRRGDKGR